MAISVQCRNKLCDEFGKPCDFPIELKMAPGEKIICGGCGYETRFIGGERPDYSRPFAPGMNTAGNSGSYEEG